MIFFMNFLDFSLINELFLKFLWFFSNQRAFCYISFISLSVIEFFREFFWFFFDTRNFSWIFLVFSLIKKHFQNTRPNMILTKIDNKFLRKFTIFSTKALLHSFWLNTHKSSCAPFLPCVIKWMILKELLEPFIMLLFQMCWTHEKQIIQMCDGP